MISAFQDPAVKVDKERFEKTIVAAQKTMTDYPVDPRLHPWRSTIWR